MLLLARRNLLSEPTRLLISAGGVALSVFLIMLLLSLYRGWDAQIGGFIDDSEVDVWVAREGTTDFLNSASILPLETAGGIAAIPAVERWSPLIVRPMEGRTARGASMDISLIGYRQDTGMGGPLAIEKGARTPGRGEVIVDEALSDRYGVDIGDTISAAGHDLKVAGISSGGNFVFWQTVFVSYEEAERILEQAGFATFILVELNDPRSEEEVVRAIEAQKPGLLAIPGDEFAAATRERVMGEVLPVFLVVVALTFIVGLAVAGLTIYTATIEKSREWGILKAVGLKNRYLYRVVFEQSIATGVVGFGAGGGLTLLIGPFATDLVPQFVLLIRWQDMMVVAGLTLLMCVLAAFIPVRRIAHVDPVAVFSA